MRYIVQNTTDNKFMKVSDEGIISWVEDSDEASFMNLYNKTSLDDAKQLLTQMLADEPVNVEELIFIEDI